MKIQSRMHFLESRIPPPLVTMAAVGVMWLAAHLSPSLTQENPLPYAPALALALIGMLVSIAAVRQFRRHGSTLDPRTPTDASALVTSGIYRHSRNPMYLGIVIALCGVAWYLSNPMALIGVAAFMLYITSFQIRPEERALLQKFGHPCREYIARVRRWL